MRTALMLVLVLLCCSCFCTYWAFEASPEVNAFLPGAWC
jgi:hypothetical protein